MYVTFADVEVGDRVCVSDGTGYVACIAPGPYYGVCIPGWHNGHSLDGHLTGDEVDCGWYFCADEPVELLEEVPDFGSEVLEDMF